MKNTSQQPVKRKGPLTVLMKGCPYKWSEKSFKENDIFFHEKDSSFNSRIIRTSVFRIRQVPIKNMG